MTRPLEQRLSARGNARLVAPPSLLRSAFPDPPVMAADSGPRIATGLAAAAALAAPMVTVDSNPSFDQRTAAITLELAQALTEAIR